MSSLDKLFVAIQAGYYKGEGVPVNVERSMLYIGSEFKTAEAFAFAKQALFEAFNKLYYDRSLSDKVLSYEEAVEAAFRSLETYQFTGSVEEANFQRRALSTLTKNPKVRKAFVEYFFGAANVAQALRIQRFKEKGTEWAEIKNEIQRLQEIRDTDPENFTADLEEELINSEITEAGIADYIFDSEITDPEDSVTGRVKQRFVGLKYKTAKGFEYADFGSVYNMVINLFQQLPTSSLEETLQALLVRLKPFASLSSTNSIREATGRHLLKIVETIYNDSKGNNFDFNPTSSVVFNKDINSPLLYAIRAKDGSAHNVSYEQAVRNPEKYTVYEMEENESFQDLLDKIKADTNLSQEVLAKTYRHFEDMAFLRSLLMATASLREAKPFVGIQHWHYGQYKSRYIPNRSSTAAKVLESRIITGFVDYSASKEFKLFSEEFLAKIEAANDDLAKREVIKEFIRLLGLQGFAKYVDNAVDDEVVNIYTALKFAAPQMNRQFIDNFLQMAESEEEFTTPHEIISDQGSLITSLVNVLNASSSLIENASYLRGDGKKAFKFQESSWQSSMLSTLDQLVGKLRHPYMDINSQGKIESSDIFLVSNIFHKASKLPSRILGFVDHDSIKTKDRNDFATYLRREKTKDYYRRNIIHGFLDALQSAGSSYVQFLPNPSNRRSIQGVRVTALKSKDALAALEHIINAQRSRPDPADFPQLARVKTYVKNRNKFKLPGLSGISTDTTLTNKELIDKVLEHNTKEAAALFEQFYSDTKRQNTAVEMWKLEKALSYFDLLPKGYTTHRNYTIALRTARKKGEDVSQMEAQRAELVKGLISKMLEQFYLNHTINQYSLSQLVYGDESFFKSKEDQTKRIQVATATGKTLLVDPTYGLPPTSRVMVLADIDAPIPVDLEYVRSDSANATFKPTDAEGFMTPEFYAKVARSAGIESDVDVVMKPVYYAILNGVPTAVKYSVKVLTDQLVSKFPHLAKLRETMREQGIDQAVFESAVKVGTPSKLTRTNE